MAELLITHIVSDAAGKPRVRGSGVAVKVIADLHNTGYTVKQIAEHFDLALGQIHAALSYYYDHKAEMDTAIQTGQALVAAAESMQDFTTRIQQRSSGKMNGIE